MNVFFVFFLSGFFLVLFWVVVFFVSLARMPLACWAAMSLCD